jgi:3-deoxy-D-manno-oct-2-ulosonic acid (Kdo) hydroxylase
VAVITKISGYTGTGWTDASARDACVRLERGEILFFATTPFELPKEDRGFLLAQKQAESRFHKNISYRPKMDEIRGVERKGADDAAHRQLKEIMRRYSAEVTQFTKKLLAPYAEKILLDFASFRPLEEEGRNLPLKKRNDLLHVDAFPTRPTHGGRILRVFTNINPEESRRWLTGEPFYKVAPRFADKAGLPEFAYSANSVTGKWRRRSVEVMRAVGLPIPDRSGYDRFMLHFHDWLKENDRYQEEERAKPVQEFPPGCTWLVFTDGVPHAALSGRFALEHTFIVPRAALVEPAAAPISVLEKLSGKALA